MNITFDTKAQAPKWRRILYAVLFVPGWALNGAFFGMSVAMFVSVFLQVFAFYWQQAGIDFLWATFWAVCTYVTRSNMIALGQGISFKFSAKW